MVIGIIKKRLNAGLKKIANENGVDESKVQIVVCFKGDVQAPEIIYWEYVDFEPKKQITFREAIDQEGKLSFTADGYEQLAANFLTNKMQAYVVVDNVKIGNLFFIIHKPEGELTAMIMDADKVIENVSINDLFA